MIVSFLFLHSQLVSGCISERIKYPKLPYSRELYSEGLDTGGVVIPPPGDQERLHTVDCPPGVELD